MHPPGSDADRPGARTREPQQARSRATRARVLRATTELIQKQGYERTSMAEIAQQAGIGTGTLYHHFGDKRAILLELIDDWGDRLAASRRSDLQLEAFMGGDPRAAVAGILRRVYERVRVSNWLYAEIFRLLERDAEVRRRHEYVERAGAEILAGLIEFGQRRGLLRRKPDPATAGFLMINAIELLVGHVVRQERPASEVERVLDELTDMLCRYLVEDV
jgi:AcrR family transcriptional regulator